MCAASRQSPFTDIITLAEVQSLADLKAFARGKAYFQDGVVSRPEEHDGVLCASVRGTHRYSVELGVGDDGELTYECDCPVGDEGIFCKHAVAVALSWLENSGEEVFHVDETEPAKPRKKRKTYEEQIREYVAALNKESLQELLLEAVERDMTLRDKLLFAARAATASDLLGMKAAVRQATRISRPLDWREAGAYGDGMMSLADMLRRHLAGPNAAQVVELAELAIAGVETSLEQIDDSGGDVMPAIMELAAVHLAACRQTRPDAVKLAERLFRLQTESVWDMFYDVLPAYAEPLGDTGLRSYRELVRNGWDALPSLAPSNEFRRSFDTLRMRLERAMERLAELDGDVDALICIRSKDLSSPYRFCWSRSFAQSMGVTMKG
ncbi:SWIM zinc finger family protein [Paraburkholderia sediminicola]|uniref:SWIM zinc finger family protein n=1 Tax=Paraburkholderia sediminicola TaxID=458836 RepID=UPI0038B84ADB